MSSAGTWPGTCRASKEVWRDVNDKSPIIDGGGKIRKRSETSALRTKSAVVRQKVSSVLADRRRFVTMALLPSPKPKKSKLIERI